MTRFTLAGIGAIALWSSLASLTTLAHGIPPFQLLTMSLAIASLLSFTISALCGRIHLTIPTPQSLALGVYGIFGYHALYFFALKLAPPAEANLINYLWPVLIVLFSTIYIDKMVNFNIIIATIAGILSMIILISNSINSNISIDSTKIAGYAVALLSSITWASYSVASRFFSSVRSDSVASAILASAVLGFASHWAFETWVNPTQEVWLAIIMLGVGPVGAAFFLWDIGMKKGNVALLGAMSYATPVCSTIALAVIGATEIDKRIALACALIVSAALLASRKQSG